MKKTQKNPSGTFFEDKGFYIILFLCVAAIAISGYVLFFTPQSALADPIDPALYSPTVTAEPEPSAALEDNVPVVSFEAEAEAEPAEPEPKTETAAPDAEAATPTLSETVVSVFVRPVSGSLTTPFSGDELIYQATLGDWRTHSGADYAANLGDRVYAIADGVVDDVFEDALYGHSVRITHANDLVTVYKGLEEKVKVKQGSNVKAGDVIGTVGDSNLAESSEDVHLHIEAIQDGQFIDPETLLTDV